MFPRLKISKINEFAGITDIDRKRRLGFINNEIPIILTWLKSELSKKMFHFYELWGFWEVEEGAGVQTGKRSHKLRCPPGPSGA